MKKGRQTIMKLIFTYILFSLSIGLLGQNLTADKKIVKIETYKKYKIIKIDNSDDLKRISDGDIEVTEMINYLTQSKTGFSGKVTENSRTKIGEIKRTYYFNEDSKLFAIIDSIKTIDNTTKKLTYYFGGGQLTSVIDEEHSDVTNTINKQQLYYWIKRTFNSQTIVK